MPTKAPRRCLPHRQLNCPDCNRPWAHKPASWATGSTRTWRTFRAQWLQAHPFCIDCGHLATIVCHKPGTDYTRDRCNPAAIEGQRCQPCDAKVTGQQGGHS